ncbi:GntR family transcriptional regulator [Sphingomonas sp. CGMCC 1.13654]|uniref:GntR family transcriptional regulator n=2 Tax=Sphingomonas chungangi TaxID=2683589 RepID=A0A838L6B4_9SPHN|nr:GntR family transcriptional regulator [Sphingomonas chungangi]MVW55038.1 GntR family transcriptional regulator [Sphingomonas chungangi]
MNEMSITRRAYQTLRAQIIGCELKPGARLNISSLQATLELSQASVREALSRLTAEGLVESDQHRGFRVSPVSATGFRELIEACMTVELPCIRSSIANGDPEWERRITAAYHRCVLTLEQLSTGAVGIDAYSNERKGFYDALLSACENKWLLWSWELLYAQNMRYRHMYLALARWDLEHLSMHREVLDAVLRRDIAKVEAMAIANYAESVAYIEQAMLHHLEETSVGPQTLASA